MKNRNLINSVLISVLTVVSFGTINAQSGSIQFDNVVVAIKTETVPPGSSDSLGNIYSSGTTFSGNIVHRVMTDTKNKMYFGYDVAVEKQGETDKFKVSIRPLSKSPNQILGRHEASALPDYDKFTAQSLPKYPEAVILDDGDTITLDILQNPQTRVKISDIIKVTSKSKKFGNYFSERENAKDFTIGDVDLRFDYPDILINGEKSKFGGGASGNVIWIYIHGKGRFIFSFSPHPGYNFQKSGVILDNKISFDHDGDSYEFINKSPVLGSGGKWNLWIMFDQNYKPSYKISPESPYQFGAADKVEYLFSNK